MEVAAAEVRRDRGSRESGGGEGGERERERWEKNPRRRNQKSNLLPPHSPPLSTGGFGGRGGGGGFSGRGGGRGDRGGRGGSFGGGRGDRGGFASKPRMQIDAGAGSGKKMTFDD